ncbi:hypothetical protein LKV13_03570 [Borrelia sp. BU AG58]|uniref:hypothetical protein n=1 Tax=Borrelia sp. BU AG58 TaxID=2887345 RepID=UPI001E4C9131|nr:hypothetical protein [Borrelia sp. BU AG58]UER67847.1 hypothetical protein LKV13_03570 [Borrelia sp. BU AG58]
MKSEGIKGNRADFRKTSRIPYWKRKRSESGVKKQKSRSFGDSDKSGSAHFNKMGNHKTNRPLEKRFRTRLVDKKVCPMCEKQIKDIASCMSVSFDNECKPIHFNCAVNKIRTDNNLLKGEDLVYRGIGKFFVVNRLIRGNNLPFKIIREIDFENLEDRPVWRKKVFEEMSKGFRFY